MRLAFWWSARSPKPDKHMQFSLKSSSPLRSLHIKQASRLTARAAAPLSALRSEPFLVDLAACRRELTARHLHLALPHRATC